ncbi:MAG: ribbon-helix-helix domain-containing protein [Nanoarchaeota archaeon]
MAIITLSIPEDLKKEMDKSRFINWSEVAREAIRTKISQLAILNVIAAKSQLTEKDALEISKKIKGSMHKKYKQENHGSY